MKTISTMIALLITALLLSFLTSWPIMLLWNGCLVGAVSGVSDITWLQAWGITVLCHFLFRPAVST